MKDTISFIYTVVMICLFATVDFWCVIIGLAMAVAFKYIFGKEYTKKQREAEETIEDFYC